MEFCARNINYWSVSVELHRIICLLHPHFILQKQIKPIGMFDIFQISSLQRDFLSRGSVKLFRPSFGIHST